MRWLTSLAATLTLAGVGFSQEAFVVAPSEPQDRPFLGSDRGFTNFIGFLSNPTQAIDPRSLTQMWPIFTSTWTPELGRLPAGDFQVYGAGLNLALTDRLSIGLNKGGYATADFRRYRDGWLDLGGFVQYTLLRDVENQCLVTAGLCWTAPIGSQELFQGSGPAYLAPYLTFGKELGDWHVLLNVGYSFPAAEDRVPLRNFYGTLHIDRQVLGWIYPVLEVNWQAATTSFNPQLTTPQGIIDLGTISGSGTLVTASPGLNFVLIRDQLEWGFVYQTPIYSQRDFQFHQFLTKMVIRF